MSNISHIENELWKSADSLRAMSNLWLQQFAEPVLGVIFLKFADMRFQEVDKELKAEQEKNAWPRWPRPLSKADYLAKGVVYLTEEAQYQYLLDLPESVNLWEALNDAMKLIEEHNPSLSWILSKSFHKLSKNIKDNNQIIQWLLKTFNSKKMNSLEWDVFGNIYEYFLGKFALADGQWSGEFFTPRSLVKLIIGIIEPFHWTIYDPACGSWWMFVQSLEYIKKHQDKTLTEATKDIAVYGQEKNETTVKIAKLSLAINGLDSSHIKEWNSFTADHHQALGKFDYVMANPPFNVKGVNKEAVQWNILYTHWVPSNDNANYLWIQMFWTTLSKRWRAGFVMANSASDARNSEATIREKIIREKAVDVMISVWPNMFYNVTLPCTLWFFDKDKVNTDRKDTVLFINAKEIFRQVDRAHREFTDEQLEYITRIAQLYRWEKVDAFDGYIAMQKKMIQKEIEESKVLLDESKDKDEKKFLQTEISTLEERLTIADSLLESYNIQFSKWYDDVPGLCKVATLEEIESNSRSLNPWRYTWVASTEDEDFDFEATMTDLHTEFQELTREAHEIEKKIVENMDNILT